MFTESHQETGTLPTLWEQDVVRRLRQRDRSAFAEMVDQFSSTVYGVALCVVGDPAAAAAISVTVFEQLWREPGDLAPTPVRGGLRALIARRARVQALVQRRAHRPPRDGARSWNALRQQPDLPDETEARDAEATQARMAGCLSTLPTAERRIVEAVAIGGDSVAEVAARMHIPAEVAAATLTDALRRLAHADAQWTTLSP